MVPTSRATTSSALTGFSSAGVSVAGVSAECVVAGLGAVSVTLEVQPDRRTAPATIAGRMLVSVMLFVPSFRSPGAPRGGLHTALEAVNVALL